MKKSVKEKVKLLILKSDLLLDIDHVQAESVLLEAQILTKDIDFQEGLLEINLKLSNVYIYKFTDYFKGFPVLKFSIIIVEGFKR